MKLVCLTLLRGALCLALASPLAAQAVLYDLQGEGDCDHFGCSVRGAGDVNGDGYDDFIVGARFGSNGEARTGLARVFSGLDGSLLLSFAGDSAEDQFGAAVSGAGDVDGDGLADLIVGSVAGSASAYLSGSARVFAGVDGSLLHLIEGQAEGDQLGVSVSGAGDVDGDGFDDYIVGANLADHNGSGSGSARVYSGRLGLLLHVFHGDAPGDELGRSVSGAGDVNGDGFDDLIVGAPGSDANGSSAGVARVFSGADGSLLYEFLGDSPYDQLGAAVSGAGDVNGDGRADLIVGAAFDDNRGNASGSARVYSGADGAVLYTFDGLAAGNHFGDSVSGAGDVNGDGLADLAVGAPADRRNGADAGSVRVISGADGSTLRVFYGQARDDCFGSAVACAGDVNADGCADLIVGAPRDIVDCDRHGSAQVILGEPYGLFLTAPLPGVAGRANTLVVTNAQPSAFLIFLARRFAGSTPVGCDGNGAAVYIDEAKVIGTSTANALGLARLDRHVAIEYSRISFRLQVVEWNTCRFSNLVEVTLR